jgi:putative DNA primase/helicase
MQERYAAIIAGMDDADIDPDYFKLITPDLQSDPMPSLSGTVGQSMIEEHLDGVELVILDNISTLTTGKENEAESWLPMQRWVLSLRRRGISVLLDHHAGRNGEQRGTSKREDVLDTMITLRHSADYTPGEGARFEVHFTKSRNIHGKDAEPFEVRMRTEKGAAVWIISSIESRIQARAAALFEDGLSVREVASELDISKSQAHRFKLLKFPTNEGAKNEE